MSYEDLATAVLWQGVNDYRAAIKKLHSEDPEAVEIGKRSIAMLEKFFLSEWGELLSNDMGAVIIERLHREQVDEYLK